MKLFRCQLTLFERVFSNDGPSKDSFLLVAWHWRGSITWRWSLTWTRKFGFHLGRPKRFRHNDGGWASIVLPVGIFWFNWQDNMFRKQKWQHDETGRICEMPYGQSPGRRWWLVDDSEEMP